mmetsp:Transcript_6859/g.11772  ORF Transcript_6859/g.11772 Transcript_6859/m.11772 type:complete len:328 (-) Transcript_6859:1491-2474(-)
MVRRRRAKGVSLKSATESQRRPTDEGRRTRALKGVVLFGGDFLSHEVQGGAGFEPLDLLGVVGVVEGNLEEGAVGPRDARRQWLPGREVAEADDGHVVVGGDAVVVVWVGESEGEHTLFLEVRLMNPREAACDDRRAAQVPRLKRRVLSGGAFAVVLVANYRPPHPSRLVGARHRRHVRQLARQPILHRVDLVVRSIDGADEHVVADVVEMAAVLEPRSGHADVVGRALALHLQQDGQPVKVLAVPRRKRRQELQAVALRVDMQDDRLRVGGRSLEGVLALIEAAGGQFVTVGSLELVGLAVSADELVNSRVERHTPRQGQRHHQLR